LTVIAYKDGIMAADSRAYAGNKLWIGSKQKIRLLADGTLIGASSTHVGGSQWALDWYAKGCPAEPGKEVNLPETFNLIAVKPDGHAFMAVNLGALTGPLDAVFFAVGSGEEYALGAMANGATAIEAVKIACRLDVWSELPLYAGSHDGAMPMLEVGLPSDQFIWIKKESE
jgi:ATP-dependent protease HslVU (ClpYQ) peptidase subunit